MPLSSNGVLPVKEPDESVVGSDEDMSNDYS